MDKNNIIKGTSFPIRYPLRHEWEISHWENTPLKNKEVIELLFQYQISNKILKDKIANLERLTKTEDNFIAYYYKKGSGSIYALNFYLLAPKENKIYFVEVIT